MKLFEPWSVLATSLLIHVSTAARIGLFPASGAYSHDQTMISAGQSLDNGTNEFIWVQHKVFQFGKGKLHFPNGWTKYIYKGCSQISKSLIDGSQQMLWETYTPFDVNRWSVMDNCAIRFQHNR